MPLLAELGSWRVVMQSGGRERKEQCTSRDGDITLVRHRVFRGPRRVFVLEGSGVRIESVHNLEDASEEICETKSFGAGERWCAVSGGGSCGVSRWGACA